MSILGAWSKLTEGDRKAGEEIGAVVVVEEEDDEEEMTAGNGDGDGDGEGEGEVGKLEGREVREGREGEGDRKLDGRAVEGEGDGDGDGDGGEDSRRDDDVDEELAG